MIFKGMNQKYETVYGAQCDRCDTIKGDSIEKVTNDFGAFKDHLELKGWKIINGADGEEHVCPDCEV